MKEQSITGKTSLVGVIGWPIGHTLSPAMHNAAFADLELNWTYVPLPVRPGDVAEAIKGLAALNFVGSNVTVPHKQAVMRYMDSLNEAARITGAVNTIHIKDGEFIGANTDPAGFINSLQEGGCYPKGMRVVVLGAGGAARAVVYALAKAEADSVVVFNRTTERAAFLVDDLADVFPDSRLGFEALTEETLTLLGNDVDLVVNTTSVGMVPQTDMCPWPDDVPVPGNAWFYDLVYNPLETTFLARARVAGANAIDGLGMLVHQGALSFSRWTGEQASVDVMRAACLQGLGIGE